jgi:hypothetical protein
LVFNVFDLVVIDWLVVCLVTPKFVVIPGTEGCAGYKNYAHHARGFAVGMIGSAVWAALVRGVVYALTRTALEEERWLAIRRRTS